MIDDANSTQSDSCSWRRILLFAVLLSASLWGVIIFIVLVLVRIL